MHMYYFVFILAFIYSWCDVLQDLINVEVKHHVLKMNDFMWEPLFSLFYDKKSV